MYMHPNGNEVSVLMFHWQNTYGYKVMKLMNGILLLQLHLLVNLQDLVSITMEHTSFCVQSFHSHISISLDWLYMQQPHVVECTTVI